MQKIIVLMTILSISGIGFIGVQIVRGKGRLALIATIILGMVLVFYNSYLEEETGRGLARHVYCMVFSCRAEPIDNRGTGPQSNLSIPGEAPSYGVTNAVTPSPPSSMATNMMPAVDNSSMSMGNASGSYPPPSTANQLAPEWLRGRLYGSDNHEAALLSVYINGSPGGYTVTIIRHMGFVCQLGVNAATGDPGFVEGCQSGRGWRTRPNRVYLHCTDNSIERVCLGDYTMISNNGGTYPGRITIARRF